MFNMIAHKTKPQISGTAVRLLQDIKEFYRERLPGIEIFFEDKDITKICVILTPQEGPFLGLRLHLSCVIPPGYPAYPPRITIDTPVNHPNVFDNYICVDIMAVRTSENKESRYMGGWTPAYTLPTVLLQFLSFFSTNKVEQDYGGYVKPTGNGQHLKFYHCKKCDYKTADMPVVDEPVRVIAEKLFEDSTFALHWPSLSGNEMQEVPTYALSTPSPPQSPPPLPLSPTIVTPITLLNDDCLLYLIDNFLNDPEIYTMAKAYTPVRRILKQHNILLKRQLVCFYLRTSFQSAVLGFGIACDPKGRPLSSEFDFLSLEAFEKYAVRKSIYNQPFDQFLPMALSESHFRRALPQIKRAFGILAGRSLDKPFDYRDVVPMMSRLMNQVVVELMAKCNLKGHTNKSTSTSTSILQASEKALEGYCFFHHLLLSMARQYPDIAVQAKAKLTDFLKSPEKRSKQYTKDLGEMLIYLTLSDDNNLQWEQISLPFLREMLTRNVVWLLDPDHQNKPHLAYLESSNICEFRLRETFAGSQTSLRLLMFQTAFLRMVGRPANLSPTQVHAAYTARYGFPAAGVPAELVRMIKVIYEVKQWPAFFTIINVPVPKKDSFTAFLRLMVKESAEKKYHQCPYSQEELFRIRMKADRPQWEIDIELKKAKRTSVPIRKKSFFVSRS